MRKRNPINTVINISKLTLRLEKFLRILAYDPEYSSFAGPIKKILGRTTSLPAVPTPEVFGMYLENYMLSAATTIEAEEEEDEPETALLVLDNLTESFGIKVSRGTAVTPQQGPSTAATTHYLELKKLTAEIHSILREMVRAYLDKHKPDKIVVYRLVKQFLGISYRLVSAAYATPSLSNPTFNECVSELDKFCWQLQKQFLDASNPYNMTIPQWAKLKEDSDINGSIFDIAVLNVGNIIVGYAGSALPQFAPIKPEMEIDLAETLDQLLFKMDPFRNPHAWSVYAILLHKHTGYFVSDEHL